MFAHFVRAWPDAPVYTALYDERATGDLVPRDRVRTSFLQKLPLRDRAFRAFAPLYPRAFESFDFSPFDLIVSSTTAWAKGIRVPPGAVHVCYVNTVSRFVFDADRYVGGFRAGALVRPLLRSLAAWDVRAAQRPTRLIANSRNVAERIRRWYGRDADVLPCAVDVDRFTVGRGDGDYAVVVSRLLPYKRVDLAIEACAIAGVPLRVVGSGPDEGRLRALAAGTATTFDGTVDDAARNAIVGAARVALLPGEEDFGLVPARGGGRGQADDRVRGRRRARDDRAGRHRNVLSRTGRARARRGASRVRSRAIRSGAAARARGGVPPGAFRRASASDRRRNRRERLAAHGYVGDVRPTRAAVVAAVVFALVYVVLDLNKLYALRYGADTGNFVQWLVGEAHGRGSWNGSEYRPHLQVHDSWALLALVPLMAAFPYTQTILLVQVLAVAGAALPLCAFARACGATPRVASAVAIAYLLSPSAQGLAYGNFLENVFVPLLAACGAVAVRQRALIPALIFAQLLLGLKEDEALFLAWFGAACALWWDRRIGLWVVALAVVNGAAFLIYEHAVHAHPCMPAYALRVDAPLDKLGFLVALIAPFAFAPLLLRWRVLLAAPLVAELIFNRPWAYAIARIGTHWTAPIVAATALSAAYVGGATPAHRAADARVRRALRAAARRHRAQARDAGRSSSTGARTRMRRRCAASRTTSSFRGRRKASTRSRRRTRTCCWRAFAPASAATVRATTRTRARSSPRSAPGRGRRTSRCAAACPFSATRALLLVQSHDHHDREQVEHRVRDHGRDERAGAVVDGVRTSPAPTSGATAPALPACMCASPNSAADTSIASHTGM